LLRPGELIDALARLQQGCCGIGHAYNAGDLTTRRQLILLK
jgi:hypothetical protein